MFRCPGCGSSMETEDPNDADYVVYGHVVCGRVCYDIGHKKEEPDARNQLSFDFEPARMYG